MIEWEADPDHNRSLHSHQNTVKPSSWPQVAAMVVGFKIHTYGLTLDVVNVG